MLFVLRVYGFSDNQKYIYLRIAYIQYSRESPRPRDALLYYGFTSYLNTCL